MWKYLTALTMLSHVLGAASCVAIDGSQIMARDVAQADPAFASVSPDFPFSYAPAIGQQRIISVSEISAWAAKAGVQTTISAPACFERPAHKLDAEEIAGAIRQAFPKNKTVQIDVIEVCKCRVPAGRLEFNVEDASAPPAGHPEMPVLWMGQLTSQSGATYPVWARVRVIAPPPDIARGSIVTVDVVNGFTHLKLTARAETAGNTGETVTLTNPQGLRRFRATITGPGLAQINLSATSGADPKEKNASLPVTTFKGTL